MNGKRTKPTGKENSNMLTAMFSKANGKTTRQMDLVPTTIKMVQNMLEIGKMMCSMEKVWRLGQMGRNMMGIITWGRKMAKECMYGMMGQSILAIGMKIKYPDLFS